MSTGPFDRRLDRAEAAHQPRVDRSALWQPLPGPQTMAYESLADVVGYGGSAGGGKTDVAIGKAITQHQRVLLLRREGVQLIGVTDRLRELLGSSNYNGSERIFRERGLSLELGSTKDPTDWNKFQGRSHDFIAFDEAANFLESQVRALMGWCRSTDPNQRCQVLMCFNPPVNAEGRWVIEFFAPWLDPAHPAPAEPGELRWFCMLAGKETEVVDGTPFEHAGELIKPQSRTFIAARLRDNPHLANTNYMATLQALPEPLRSQMLHGDFMSGVEDDAQQVIPSDWVNLAMSRWKPLNPLPPMDSIGCDVARGGRDSTLIARRHGYWFDRPLVHPGTQTPDGPIVAALVISAQRDQAPIHIDVIGVGSSPYDFLRSAQQQVIGVNVSEAAYGTDHSGRLRFFNQRSELVWRMREALDPIANNGIALPPDSRLKSDLCAFTWELRGQGIIYVHSRDEIMSRIGRSPDWASAYFLALKDTPKRLRTDEFDISRPRGNSEREYDPYSVLSA